MERHEILAGNIDWSQLVQHVIRDKVAVELAEGEKPVAMLIPIESPKSMAGLDKALREVPSLGDDAELFESDIRAIRKEMKPLDDPWES